MSIEISRTEPRTKDEVLSRNNLQRLLIEKALEEGILESKSDLKKMNEIFRAVSDIIDNNDPAHESIREAYKSGDYDAAAQMLLNIFKK